MGKQLRKLGFTAGSLEIWAFRVGVGFEYYYTEWLYGYDRLFDFSVPFFVNGP